MTEEVTGVDIVCSQLDLAMGKSLPDMVCTTTLRSLLS